MLTRAALLLSPSTHTTGASGGVRARMGSLPGGRVAQALRACLRLHAALLLVAQLPTPEAFSPPPPPPCDETQSGRGVDYRGCQTHTVNGRACQKWTSQSPHEHSRTAENYPDKGLGDHAYCRNPDNWYHGIWCYTTTSWKRFEACDPLPFSPPPPRPPPPPPQPPPPPPPPPPPAPRAQRVDAWRACEGFNRETDCGSQSCSPGHGDGSKGFACCCLWNHGYIRLTAYVTDPGNVEDMNKYLVWFSNAWCGNQDCPNNYWWKATFEGQGRCGNGPDMSRSVAPEDGFFYSQYGCGHPDFNYDSPWNTLQPGNYSFKLHATGPDDSWSGDGADAHHFYDRVSRAPDTFEHRPGMHTNIFFNVTVGDSSGDYQDAA